MALSVTSLNHGVSVHRDGPATHAAHLVRRSIIIIIIIINEKINVAYNPKTSRTRNKQKKENSDVFGRWKHRRSQRH